MANLKETAKWEPGIYQLEESDPVVGGPNGIDNLQAKQLGNRTLYLRDFINKIIDGNGIFHGQINVRDVIGLNDIFKSKLIFNSATNSTSENQIATPKAVKTVYDLANTANTAANVAKSTAETDATTARKGRVQLNSAIDSTSESHAATSLAVKKLYDKVETKFSKSGGLLGGSVKIDGELELNRSPCALIFSAPGHNKKMILKNNNSDSFVMSYYDEKYWYDFFRFTAESKIVDFKHVNNVTIDNKSVLKKGDYGIGTQGMVVDSTNRQLGKSGFIAITANNDDKPEVNGGVCGFQSFSTNNGYGMQLVSTNSFITPLKIFVRIIENDKKVSKWVEILKQNDYGIGAQRLPIKPVKNFADINSIECGSVSFVKAEDTSVLPSSTWCYLHQRGKRDGYAKGGAFTLQPFNTDQVFFGRVVESTEKISWSECITTKNLSDYMSNYLPVGVPIPYPGSTVPPGFLKLNGWPFDKKKYPKLAKVYPSGILIDMRSETIRGWDDGRGVDVGRTLLSSQNHQIASHKHVGGLGESRAHLSDYDRKNYSAPFGSTGLRGTFLGLKADDFDNPLYYTNDGTNGSFTDEKGVETSWKNLNPDGRVGNETRVRNVAFMYIVKAE